MGRPQPDYRDLALAVGEGTFTAVGNSPAVQAQGGINVTLTGTFVATLRVARSFDGGTTWAPLSDQDGYAIRSYTGPASFWIWENEAGVLYRLECTAYTSGTVAYRLSC